MIYDTRYKIIIKILLQKRNIMKKLITIEMILTKNCNLKCPFCYLQNQKDPIPNEDDIRAMIDCFDQCILTLPQNVFVDINFMGGEIMLYPSLYAHYITLYQHINSVMHTRAQPYSFNIYSNLIASPKKVKQLEKLFNCDNVQFLTSYDVKGRFNNVQQRTLWLSNLKYLTTVLNRRPIISLCGSNINLAAVVDRTDELLNWLIDNFSIFIDPCFETGSTNSYTVSKLQYQEYCSLIMSQYPNIVCLENGLSDSNTRRFVVEIYNRKWKSYLI